jgi:TetR/AcrR family transcriptional regulator, transcriptional repressor for nem operon
MRDSQPTIDLIIEKATPLFNKQGYRATSISDITKATGLTKGAIYGNFENKDALAVAAYEAASMKVLGAIKQRIKSAETAPLKLKAIASYYGEYTYNPPFEGGCPIINTAIEADDNHPFLRTKVVETITMIKDSIQKIIYRGIAEGQITKEIDVAAFANIFYASIKGAILITQIEGNATTYTHVKKNLLSQIDDISL